MILHVLCLMRNEEIIMPYFLRYYSTIADKIIIMLDTTSTDRTREMALANPLVELHELDFYRGFNEADKAIFTVEAYKKYSRGIADWVINVDSDEFYYTEDLRKTLEDQRLKGVRLLRAGAYLMISETVPTTTGQIYEESNMGKRCRYHDKTNIFDPSLDIEYRFGQQQHCPIEGVPVRWAQIKLLHYRCLSRQYFIDRTVTNLSRYGYGSRLINQRLRTGLQGFDRDIKNLTKII